MFGQSVWPSAAFRQIMADTKWTSGLATDNWPGRSTMQRLGALVFTRARAIEPNGPVNGEIHVAALKTVITKFRWLPSAETQRTGCSIPPRLGMLGPWRTCSERSALVAVMAPRK